jgi:histidinol phosphatase-like PHP family hydrolase
MLIKQDLLELTPGIDIYFGAEVNDFISGDWDFTKELMEECGFQYAIGGIHDAYIDEYDLKKIVDIQQEHHLKTCQNPLLNVLVHPYWFSKGAWDKRDWPWFDAMKAVPESYARELGQAAKETGTAIEINGSAILDSANYSEQFCREYMDYLAAIAAEGATFAFASDAHDISALKTVEKTWQVAKHLGLTADRIWHPNCQPMVMREGSKDKERNEL